MAFDLGYRPQVIIGIFPHFLRELYAKSLTCWGLTLRLL